MEHKNIKKTVGIASMSLAVIAGTAAGIKYYNSGNIFVPSMSGRDFVVNQVRFDNGNDVMGKEDNKKGNDSSFWEKSKDDENNSYGAGGNSGYLFDNPQTGRPSQDDNINIITPDIDNGNSPSADDGIQPGPSYDIIDDKNKADTIIDGKDHDDVIKPSDDTDNNGGNSNGNNAGGSNNTPGANDNDNNNNSNNNNGGNSGNGGSADNGNNDVPDNNGGYKRPAETAKDPEVIKDKPNIGVLYKPFEEEDFKNTGNDDMQVIIRMNTDADNNSALYKGQTISAYMVFCALDTYVYNSKTDAMYYWGDSSFNRYIRVDGVSFDGGNSWNNRFPITIPDDVNDGDMFIRVSYKTQESGKWEEKDVDYSPMSSRIFVLSEKLKTGNQTISNTNILNSNQFVTPGETVNLYTCQSKMLEEGELSALFPGWEENGKLVPWEYAATAGRHILEPADMVALDDKYIVQKKYHWLSDGDAADGRPKEIYCVLQTLTGIRNDSNPDTIDVPQYVQAVKFDDKTVTDYIKLPDTVVTFSSDNLHVSQGYIVDKDNPVYKSSRGVLINSEMTEIIAIPCRMTWLDIPSSISSIRLTDDNSLKEIRFNAGSISGLPQMDYSCLDNCKIIVEDTCFDDFIMTNGDVLAKGNNTVAMQSNPKLTYRLTNGAIVNSDGGLYKITETAGTSISLTDDIRTICTGAFENAGSLENIIMPESGDVVLEKDCLKGTSVRTIICNTQQQFENISSMISISGGENIELVLMQNSSDGYKYYKVHHDGVAKTVLAEAPADVEEFDGTVENGTISVDSIGTYAFADCYLLKWVSLSDTVKKIEDCSFMNCKALQGVLINSTDIIEIENKAFDGCDSIRFIASNAMKCIMDDSYDPLITDENDNVKNNFFFMTLAGSEGYGRNTSKGSTDIVRYDTIKTGGSRILYGVDEYDIYYIALRAGVDISGSVKLPEYTTTIGKYAFSGAENEFTLNWDGTNIYELCDSAFYGSGICGDISIPDKGGIQVGDSVFAACERITSICFDGTLYKLGKEVFVYCTSLEKVEFSSFDYWRAGIYAGIFNGCGKLTDIVFGDSIAPRIAAPSVGFRFMFNYDLTLEEEKARIHITVPEDAVSSYIMDWRYNALGYVDYSTMWNNVQFDLFMADFIWPEDEAVDAAVKEQVIETENYVRALLGLDEQTHATDYFPYREDNGMVTLIDISAARKEIDIGASYMGLPDGWYYDYIGRNAFSGCQGLEKVIIPDNLTGIESGAFTDAASQSGGLVVECLGKTPFELIADAESGLFEFGTDDEKLTVLVPEGCKKIYITAWSEYIDEERLNIIIKERENTEE